MVKCICINSDVKRGLNAPFAASLLCCGWAVRQFLCHGLKRTLWVYWSYLETVFISSRPQLYAQVYQITHSRTVECGSVCMPRFLWNSPEKPALTWFLTASLVTHWFWPSNNNDFAPLHLPRILQAHRHFTLRRALQTNKMFAEIKAAPLSLLQLVAHSTGSQWSVINLLRFKRKSKPVLVIQQYIVELKNLKLMFLKFKVSCENLTGLLVL